MNRLTEYYWTERYKNHNTGWDIGYVSTPLKDYFDQLENKNLKILIPGCGNAHEAAYLHDMGFMNVHLLDISEIPLLHFSEQHPDFPKANLVHCNFFDHFDDYDLIIEQTFFCALDTALRPQYVSHMHKLLRIGGKLTGLLFNIPLYIDHPPFGGHKDQYRELFKDEFEIEIMEEAFNSIPPRAGNELFIKLIKT
jgi:hypothetical protein